MLFFSSLLPEKFTADAENIFSALTKCGERYFLFDGAKDIWVRDYMPIKTRNGKYISFRYEPSYLKGYDFLRTDFSIDIAPQFDFSVIYSDINLDGGNAVFSPSRGRVIISDRIFSGNPSREQKELCAELSKLFDAEIFIIPSLKSDMTGHSDGMVRFLDEETVLCNRSLSPFGFEQKIKHKLRNYGFCPIDFPFAASNGGSAAGTYLNYLETDSFIFLPTFEIVNDSEALSYAEKTFAKPVFPISIPNIAADGGCLNCISWEK